MKSLIVGDKQTVERLAEHLWEAVREERFANHVFANLDAVEGALTQGLMALESNLARTQSLAGFDWIISISLNVN